jgi:dUTP pyrophosphatase
MMLRYSTSRPGAKLTRGSEHAAGLDLYCVAGEEIVAGGVTKIPTGIHVEIPEGWVGLIRDRSSLGAKGISVLGGVIDSDYRGEIFVCLTKTSGTYFFNPGDRIAQLVVVPHYVGQPTEVLSLSETARGEGGFGSTGK